MAQPTFQQWSKDTKTAVIVVLLTVASALWGKSVVDARSHISGLQADKARLEQRLLQSETSQDSRYSRCFEALEKSYQINQEAKSALQVKELSNEITQ